MTYHNLPQYIDHSDILSLKSLELLRSSDASGDHATLHLELELDPTHLYSDEIDAFVLPTMPLTFLRIAPVEEPAEAASAPEESASTTEPEASAPEAEAATDAAASTPDASAAAQPAKNGGKSKAVPLPTPTFASLADSGAEAAASGPSTVPAPDASTPTQNG